jgi:excisionase family DNA binding protein
MNDQVSRKMSIHQQTHAPQGFLTVLEGAAYVGCCPESVRRAIRGGRLRAGRVGSEYRVTLAALHDWVGITE